MSDRLVFLVWLWEVIPRPDSLGCQDWQAGICSYRTCYTVLSASPPCAHQLLPLCLLQAFPAQAGSLGAVCTVVPMHS